MRSACSARWCTDGDGYGCTDDTIAERLARSGNDRRRVRRGVLAGIRKAGSRLVLRRQLLPRVSDYSARALSRLGAAAQTAAVDTVVECVWARRGRWQHH